ncbi:MAG: hypothetical protein JW927_01395 [Deltaproteobacteria bacterium]|nr:hypothetical protein [Deltaproteobacteria bacterium]
MGTQERVNANMEQLKQAVDSMEPLLKQCSITMINLSANVAALMSRGDAGAIEEMKQVADEIFARALEAMASMNMVKQ